MLLKANLNLLTALEIVEVAGLAAGEAPDHLDSDTGVALTTTAANKPSAKFSQSWRRPLTRAFFWLKEPTSAFAFKKLLIHYAKRALTPR